MYQKSWAFHILIQKELGQPYTFLLKKGLIIYLAALKKGAIRHAHPYYGIYRKLTPTHLAPERIFLITPSTLSMLRIIY